VTKLLRVPLQLHDGTTSLLKSVCDVSRTNESVSSGIIASGSRSGELMAQQYLTMKWIGRCSWPSLDSLQLASTSRHLPASPTAKSAAAAAESHLTSFFPLSVHSQITPSARLIQNLMKLDERGQCMARPRSTYHHPWPAAGPYHICPSVKGRQISLRRAGCR